MPANLPKRFQSLLETSVQNLPPAFMIKAREQLKGITWKWAVGVLIGFGILLRIIPYLHNRSLWTDEARLALNILEKTFSQLMGPLDFKQMAPIGFLFIEKSLVLTFGDSEYALRAFPLFAGILSLFLFYEVGRRILTSRGLIMGLGLFVLSEPLIRYSSELKQYSSDVTIALSIYWLGLLCIEKQFRFILFLSLASIAGAGLIWFSHPAIFSLAGLGVTLTLYCLTKKKWHHLPWLFLPAGFWLGSFALNYFFTHLDLGQNSPMVKAWSSTTAFMPAVSSFGDLIWYPQQFFTMFSNPGGLSFLGLATLCFITGWIALFVEKHHACLLLTLPILFTLLASSLHMYPFHGRLILFLVPAMMIFIGEGMDRIFALASPKNRVVGVTLCLLLVLAAVKNSVPNVLIPERMEREAIKPVMTFLKKNYQPEDKIYLYYSSWPAFHYYTKQLHLEEMEYQKGKSNRYYWDGYVNELRELKGHSRVWVLFSHVYRNSGVDEEKFFLYFLNGMGKQMATFKQKGASIYLFDLS